MDPYQLEVLFGEFLSRHGWATETTRGSGDGGVDVYAESPRSDPQCRVGFDVKRHTESSLSPSDLNRLVSKLDPDRPIDRYCIVVTRPTFSRAVKRRADQLDTDLIGLRGLTEAIDKMEDTVLFEQYRDQQPASRECTASALRQRLLNLDIYVSTDACHEILSYDHADELIYSIERQRRPTGIVGIATDTVMEQAVPLPPRFSEYPFPLSANVYWGGGRTSSAAPWRERTTPPTRTPLVTL